VFAVSVGVRLSICPSVWLSMTFVYCIQTADNIVILLSRPGSTITLVFHPFSGGAKYAGWEKSVIFNWNCRLSRERYEIGPWLLLTVNKSQVTDRSVSVPMTLSDLERREAMGQIFQVDLLNNILTVWPRTTKFGRKTRVEEECISRGQPRPYRKERCPSARQFWMFPSIYAHTLWRRSIPNLTW